LKDCRLVGRQLRYLIGLDHGWLGAIGFGSCALHLSARGEWIGWDSSTRKSFQERLINMTRFLIRQQVHCQNLASRVLSLCIERVGSDFAARYGFEPWLLESFVDTEQHLGTSYQAANWLPVGTTTGLGRNAHSSRPSKTPKAVYVYELTRNWRSRMGLPARSERIKDPEPAIRGDICSIHFGTPCAGGCQSTAMGVVDHRPDLLAQRGVALLAPVHNALAHRRMASSSEKRLSHRIPSASHRG